MAAIRLAVGCHRAVQGGAELVSVTPRAWRTTMWQHGHFYWNELMTRDVEGAKAFYAGTLGWRFDGMPMAEVGTYWVCKDGDQPLGGILDMSPPQFDGLPPHWFAYIAVDDVDARVAKATAAGAELLRPL